MRYSNAKAKKEGKLVQKQRKGKKIRKIREEDEELSMC